MADSKASYYFVMLMVCSWRYDILAVIWRHIFSCYFFLYDVNELKKNLCKKNVKKKTHQPSKNSSATSLGNC